MGDRYFDPWDGRSLLTCKRIMAKARGDEAEAVRRMRHLWAWCQVNPDYWRFTPQNLLGKWDDLHLPPAAMNGGAHALRRQAENLGQQRAKDYIRETYRGDGAET
jgi:hypothetical protein